MLAQKYHITPEGIITKCAAQEGNCPFVDDDGNPAKHYDDYYDARDAYAERMRAFETPKTMTSNAYLRYARKYIEDNPLLKKCNQNFLRKRITPYREEDCIRAAAEYCKLKIDAIYSDNFEEALGYQRLEEVSSQLSLLIGGAQQEQAEKIAKFLLKSFSDFIEQPISVEDGIFKFGRIRKEIDSDSGYYQQDTLQLDSNGETLYTDAIIGFDDEGRKIKLSTREKRQLNNDVKETANKFVSQFENAEGKFVFPDPLTKKDREEFSVLGRGAECIAYLHKPTMMVYKIPHEDNPLLMQGKNTEFSSQAINKMSQTTLETLDKKTLSSLKVKYLPTFFVNAQTKHGKNIGITVQPYMAKNRFREYMITHQTEQTLKKVGFTDLHEGNVHYDFATKTVYLNDCLTWGDDKQERFNEFL